MADIFISYSSKNGAKASQLCDRLSSAGFSCWFDESNITPAARWSSEIVKAIEECKVFIILLSLEAIGSQNVLNELSIASEEKKHIFPIYLEPIELPHDFKFQLAGLQHTAYKEYDLIENAVRIACGKILPNAKKRNSSHSRKRWKKFAAVIAAVLLLAITYFFVTQKSGSGVGKAAFPTVNQDAYKLYVEAFDIYKRTSKNEYLYAIQLLEASVRLDSTYADAYALMELLHNTLATDAKVHKNRSIHIGTFWQQESDW